MSELRARGQQKQKQNQEKLQKRQQQDEEDERQRDKAGDEQPRSQLRRAGSCNQITDLDNLATEWKSVAPDKPLHSLIDSPFSSASGFNNFRGLLNLGIILLVVSNFRVALENVIKYGILVDPLLVLKIFVTSPKEWLCLCLIILSNVFILISYWLELLAARGTIVGKPLACLHIANMLAVLTVPSYYVLLEHPSPFYSAPTLGVFTIIFLKLWSYRDVNSWCRYELKLRSSKRIEHRRNKSLASAMEDLQSEGADWSELRSAAVSQASVLTSYPNNLTLGNIYYFMLAPTLCYELNYPKIFRIRKRFLAKRLIELIFLPQVMAALVQQWIVPILNNSLKPLQESAWPVMLERLLKLAIPNHLIWLIFFYVFFHSALNVIGELLLFGDRSFYKDWWNSETVTEFWALWNIPVHRFAKRHIFTPLLHRWRVSKFTASVAVFAISAFFHELLVSVPLRMFRIWAFSAMLMQVPFAMFVSGVLKGGQLGNLAVWLCLIIGQPLAALMYFHDYYFSWHAQQGT